MAASEKILPVIHAVRNEIFNESPVPSGSTTSSEFNMEGKHFLGIGIDFTKGSLTSCTLSIQAWTGPTGGWKGLYSSTEANNWSLAMTANTDRCVHVGDTGTTKFLPMTIIWNKVRIIVTTVGTITSSSLVLYAAAK